MFTARFFTRNRLAPKLALSDTPSKSYGENTEPNSKKVIKNSVFQFFKSKIGVFTGYGS